MAKVNIGRFVKIAVGIALIGVVLFFAAVQLVPRPPLSDKYLMIGFNNANLELCFTEFGGGGFPGAKAVSIKETRQSFGGFYSHYVVAELPGGGSIEFPNLFFSRWSAFSGFWIGCDAEKSGRVQFDFSEI